MEKKKNKVLVIFVIVLSIIFIGIVIFVAYHKLNNPNENVIEIGGESTDDDNEENNYDIDLDNVISLSGRIESDLVLTADNNYILSDDVAINDDVTLTIEPGVKILGNNNKIYNKNGLINAIGNEEKNIYFYDINIVSDDNNGHAKFLFSYVNIDGYLDLYSARFVSLKIDNSVIKSNNNLSLRLPNEFYMDNCDVQIERGISIMTYSDTKIDVKNSDFKNCNNDGYVFKASSSGSESVPFNISYCNFYDDGIILKEEYHGYFVAVNNYWNGSNSVESIEEKIIDARSDMSLYNNAIYSPWSATPY